jgi:hypothetical protein
MEPRQLKRTPPSRPSLDPAVYSIAIAVNVVLLIVVGRHRMALGSRVADGHGYARRVAHCPHRAAQQASSGPVAAQAGRTKQRRRGDTRMQTIQNAA